MFKVLIHFIKSNTGINAIIFSMAFFTQSCIDPVPLQVTDEDGILVVEGLITNQSGPYKVKLTRSGKLNKFGGVDVGQAEVNISDDMGNQERLVEVSPGLYQTDSSGIRGTVGRSYKLSIILSTGEKYISLPELMQPVSSIDTIYFKQISWLEFIHKDTHVEVEKDGFQVYIEMINPSHMDNFYLWKSEGIFEYYTYGDCCNTCYQRKSRFNQDIVLANDQFFKSYVKWKQPVVLINNLPGVYQTYVEVSQYSISFRAFEYWKQIQQQRSNVGSIFDPPPTEIKGNIIAEDDTKAALGFFGASAVNSRHIIIRNNRFLSQKELPRTGVCTSIYSGSSTERPPEFD